MAAATTPAASASAPITPLAPLTQGPGGRGFTMALLVSPTDRGRPWRASLLDVQERLHVTDGRKTAVHTGSQAGIVTRITATLALGGCSE